MARDEQARYGAPQLTVPLSVNMLMAGAMIMLVISLAMASWIETPRYVATQGLVWPRAGIAPVYSSINGVVQDVRVTTGRVVHKGEVLFVLDAPGPGTVSSGERHIVETSIEEKLHSTRRELQHTSDSLAAELQNVAARLDMIDGELALAREEAAVAQQKVAVAQLEVTRQQELVQSGFVSASAASALDDRVLEARRVAAAAGHAVLTLQREQAALLASRIQLRKQQVSSAEDGRQKLADLGEQLALTNRRKSTEILADDDGVVSQLDVIHGAVVETGALLCGIVPSSSPLVIRLSVKSGDVGMLAVGQQVRLRFPSFPVERYGMGEGRIESLTLSLVDGQELHDVPRAGASGDYHRANVIIEKLPAEIANRLRVGLQVRGDIEVERRSLLRWLLAPFASEMRQL